LSKKYAGRVDFLLVYIREAHPTDQWQVPRNIEEKVLLESAKTQAMKDDHATACVRTLGIQFPAVVDNMENSTEAAYTAWPDRLYLVNKQGKITYKSAPGPGGFKSPGLAAAIEKELSPQP